MGDLEAIDWDGEPDLEDEGAQVDAESLQWLDGEGGCWTSSERRWTAREHPSMGMEAGLYYEGAPVLGDESTAVLVGRRARGGWTSSGQQWPAREAPVGWGCWPRLAGR